MAKTVEATVYSTIPMQLYMMHSIKNPILNSIETIFNPDASKLDKFKSGRNLLKAFKAISKMPEPTIENTWHPNSHNMIILRDHLLKRLTPLKLSDARRNIISRFFNLLITINDFDPPWRWMIDSVKDEALKMKWESREYGRTGKVEYPWWREDEIN